MHPLTLFRLFLSPTQGWRDLMKDKPSIHRLYLLHVIPFALIPSLMIYIAGDNHSQRFFELLPGNKLIIVAVALFLVQLVIVPAMASIVRQLAEVAEITHRTSKPSCWPQSRPRRCGWRRSFWPCPTFFSILVSHRWP